MAGGTKRLPRAVREQQMLDAAVQMFSVNGYHETSMDAIAAQAEISKPMLYLYYGSKEELFAACLDRELTRFVDTVRADINWKGIYWEPYVFVGAIFFLICFGMSRYSMYLERRLQRDHR